MPLKYPVPPTPRTSTGALLSVVVPFPSIPQLFWPQLQTVPSAFNTSVISAMAPIESVVVEHRGLVGVVAAADGAASWLLRLVGSFGLSRLELAAAAICGLRARI